MITTTNTFLISPPGGLAKLQKYIIKLNIYYFSLHYSHTKFSSKKLISTYQIPSKCCNQHDFQRSSCKTNHQSRLQIAILRYPGLDNQLSFNHNSQYPNIFYKVKIIRKPTLNSPLSFTPKETHILAGRMYRPVTGVHKCCDLWTYFKDWLLGKL